MFSIDERHKIESIYENTVFLSYNRIDNIVKYTIMPIYNSTTTSMKFENVRKLLFDDIINRLKADEFMKTFIDKLTICTHNKIDTTKFINPRILYFKHLNIKILLVNNEGDDIFVKTYI